MRPLLSLCLLQKDEAKSLQAILESLRPFIDNFTIVDTGSTDASRRIALDTLKDKPGYLHDEPFRGGFAQMRNRVLELDAQVVEPAVFTLTWSGDEFLRHGKELREFLETQRETDTDAFFLNLALDTGMSRQARILRTGSKWRYDDFGLGIHEVPVHPDGDAAKKALVPTAFIEHLVTDPLGRMDNIWENHIPKLREALEKDPVHVRALEFLIQSLESFFPHMEEDEREAAAIECVDLYRRRFELPFVMKEQRLFFAMRFVDTARLSNLLTPDELFTFADELCKTDDSRPEPFLLRGVFAAQRATSKTSEVYNLAREAALVAEKVRLAGGLNNSSPLDMSTEWKAHRLAALAASNLAKKHPEQMQLAKDHIAAGLSVGGPWMMFKGIIDDGKVELKIGVGEGQ